MLGVQMNTSGSNKQSSFKIDLAEKPGNYKILDEYILYFETFCIFNIFLIC